MWRSVGLFRTRQALEAATAALDGEQAVVDQVMQGGELTDPERWKHFNLVTVARLIAQAALRREESRGAHFREDFPERDDINWKIHLVDQQNLKSVTTDVTEKNGTWRPPSGG